MGNNGVSVPIGLENLFKKINVYSLDKNSFRQGRKKAGNQFLLTVAALQYHLPSANEADYYFTLHFLTFLVRVSLII